MIRSDSVTPTAVKGMLIGLLGILMSLSSYANTQAEQEIGQYVGDTMDSLILRLKQNEAKYTHDSELFYEDLNYELSKVIDFKRIAMKVMGKYGRKANKDQKIAFVSTFKQSLYKTYSKTLLDNSDVSAKVLSTAINNRNPKKAKVDLEITNSNGTTFPLVYSMHKGKDGVYRVENIMVLGINIGLALREHFQQQIKQHKGSVADVIKHWSFEQVEERAVAASS